MLAKTTPAHVLATPETIRRAGQAANAAAARAVFSDYQGRKAANTLRRQAADLDLLAQFLQSAGLACGDLANDPAAWKGITWGLLAAWQRWQLQQGYAVGSVNVRLSTAKTYARLAMQAGALKSSDYALIRSVDGYQHKETGRIDAARIERGGVNRIGAKKGAPVSINAAQARALKAQPNTPQGRRDALIMCLLLDHGLRVGELAGLERGCFDLESGLLTFYREKVSKVQTHRLTVETLAAARSYLQNDAPTDGLIWRGSLKSGRLAAAGMSNRALTERVRALGAAVGLQGLSAHDCRHAWATAAARNGTAIDRLQDAGGWASLAMPLRYVESAAIANQGVILC